MSTVALPQPAVPKLVARTTQKALLDGLKFVTAAIPSRPPTQALLGVKIAAARGGVTLSAFDYEISCTETITGGGQGEVLVPGKLLLDIVKMLDAGHIILRVQHRQLVVEQGALSYDIDYLPLENYPALPETGPVVLATLSGAQLTALNRASVAAGKDSTLPILTALCLDSATGRLVCAATDRYRLAVVTSNVKAKKVERMLVPHVNLSLIAKAFATEDAITLSIPSDKNRARNGMLTATAGQRRVTTRLQEGEFPKYDSLLPSDDAFSGEATVDVAKTAKAVKQVALIAAHNAPVRFVSAEGLLTIHGGSLLCGQGDKATKKLDDALTGMDVDIGFNPTYLLAGLASTGKASRIRFNGNAKPAVLSDPNDSTFRYLLMPVRLADR